MSGVRYRGGKNYSAEEDNIIIEHVLEQPENLREAFRKAAVVLEENGRKTASFDSVQQTYYNRIRKQYPIFTLEGRDQSLSNTKVISRRTKTIYAVENPTVAQLARQYNKLTSKQKQDFQVLIK